MCITRVGKVTLVSKGKASVDFFDGRALDGVDVSMVGAVRGDFVEVFGNFALSVLTISEAAKRKEAWEEVRKAVMIPLSKRARTL